MNAIEFAKYLTELLSVYQGYNTISSQHRLKLVKQVGALVGSTLHLTNENGADEYMASYRVVILREEEDGAVIGFRFFFTSERFGGRDLDFIDFHEGKFNAVRSGGTDDTEVLVENTLG